MGTLSTVATDELRAPRAIKVQSRHVADATGGHVRVETRVPIIYTEGVSKRRMPLERFVAVWIVAGLVVSSLDSRPRRILQPRRAIVAAADLPEHAPLFDDWERAGKLVAMNHPP